MKEYFERRITYDPTTENYKVSVPELGIEVLSDTEVGGLKDARKEVRDAVIRQAPMVTEEEAESPYIGTLPYSTDDLKGWITEAQKDLARKMSTPHDITISPTLCGCFSCRMMYGKTDE